MKKGSQDLICRPNAGRYWMMMLVVAGITLTGFAQVSPISEQQARESGDGHDWQGTLGDVNMYSLAKQTSVPIVKWDSRGNLSVNFELHHNSRAVYSNPTMSAKWSHSYDTHLDFWVDPVNGNPRAGLVWGNHTVQLFEYNGAQWVNLDGYRDHLIKVVPGPDWMVETKEHTRFYFEPGGTPNRFRLKALVDSTGNALTYTYDAMDRLVQMTDPSGRVLQLTYSGGGKLNQVRFVVGAWNRIWNLNYNGAGDLASVTFPSVTTDSGVQIYSTGFIYDPMKNVAVHTDLSGQNWQYTYDANSRIMWAQWPNNTPAQRQIYTYAPPLRTLQDPTGMTTTYEYDALGRLVRVQDGLLNSTTFQYSSPNYAYAPTRITMPSGVNTQYTYDARGNTLTHKDAAGNTTNYTYDSRDRLTQILEPLVTDAWGVPNAFRNKTKYAYDSFDRLINVKRYDTSSTFLIEKYSYDTYGNLTKITNPNGKITKYTYDTYGNLTKVTTPMLRVTSWKFTDVNKSFGFSQPQLMINGLGQQIKYVRDEWGRVRTKDYPAGTDTKYSYDAMSRLIKVVDSTGTMTRTYNLNGWILTETTPVYTDGYTYYPNGLRASLVEGSGAISRTLTYTYDGANRLQHLFDDGLMTNFTYDADSNMIRRDYPNGAYTTFTFAQDRLTGEQHYTAGGTLMGTYLYDYQQDGLLRQMQDPHGMVRYDYDALSRLVREERTGAFNHNYLWILDPMGNRLSQDHNGVLTTYIYDDDNLPLQATTGANTNTYTWNANCALIERWQSGAGTQFVYDYDNRLTNTLIWNGSAWVIAYAYTYDGLDRRRTRNVFDASGALTLTTGYCYDNFILNREVSNDIVLGNYYTTCTWASGLLGMSHSTGGRLWTGTDFLGNVRDLTNPFGQPGPQVNLHNAFGEVLFNGFQFPFGFGADFGQFGQPDAGLTFTGNSWWDSFLAGKIWLNPAPIQANNNQQDDGGGFFWKFWKKIRTGVTVAGWAAKGSGTLAGTIAKEGTKLAGAGSAVKAAGPVLQKAGVVMDAVQSTRLLVDAAQDTNKANDKAAAGDYGASLQGWNMIGKAAIGDWKGIEEGAKKSWLGQKSLAFGNWLGNKLFGD